MDSPAQINNLQVEVVEKVPSLTSTRVDCLVLAAVFVIAVIARLGWLWAVPPYGDSLKYWEWARTITAGEGASFSHSGHWTASYPGFLIALSLGQRLDFTTTSILQVVVQAALVVPVAKVLRMMDFDRFAVACGALAVAVAPYSAFAGSRPLADPLATLLWWTGIVRVLTLVQRREQTAIWWINLLVAAVAIGLAAHLRINMVPAVGVSCLALILYSVKVYGCGRTTLALTACLFVACVPALQRIMPARQGAHEFLSREAAVQAWASTYYLGYDRWYRVVSSVPWNGDDPRPYLPEGWKTRDDGPDVDEMIDAALSSTDKSSADQFAQHAEAWKRKHPIQCNIWLPIVRVIAAWVPLAPELWVRFSVYRLCQYIERLVTLLGLVVMTIWTLTRSVGREYGPLAVVLISSAFFPTVTILVMQLIGVEVSDYRVHHAGWVVCLAFGSAWLARRLQLCAVEG